MKKCAWLAVACWGLWVIGVSIAACGDDGNKSDGCSSVAQDTGKIGTDAGAADGGLTGGDGGVKCHCRLSGLTRILAIRPRVVEYRNTICSRVDGGEGRAALRAAARPYPPPSGRDFLS